MTRSFRDFGHFVMKFGRHLEVGCRNWTGWLTSTGGVAVTALAWSMGTKFTFCIKDGFLKPLKLT
jgi:hypothetical protein